MTKPQKTLILCAALIAAGFILYPPWVEYYYSEGGSVGKNSRGHHFLWDRPENTPGLKPKAKGVRISSSELSKPLVILGIVTFVGFAWLGAKKRRKTAGTP